MIGVAYVQSIKYMRIRECKRVTMTTHTQRICIISRGRKKFTHNEHSHIIIYYLLLYFILY